MPLDRTWYNTLVDDSGTGTDGTIWNKAQIDNLMDVIDAGFGAAGAAYVLPNADTGTITSWAPGAIGNTLIVWTGASNLTVHGLAGGQPGQQIRIVNIGTAIVFFVHASGSTPFANYVSSQSTPIAPGGSVTYQHDGIYWRVMAHTQGRWITPPFSASNFAGDGGTWTVDAADVGAYSYVLSGTSLSVNVYLVTTSTTAMTRLIVVIPGGFTAREAVFGPQSLVLVNGTTWVAGTVTLNASQPNLYLAPLAGTITARTNDVYATCQLTFPVQ